MKREIKFGWTSSISLISGWINEDSFDDLRNKVELVKTDIIKTFQMFDPDIKGLKIRYFLFDEDDFGGDDVSDEVQKWGVEFIPLDEEKYYVSIE